MHIDRQNKQWYLGPGIDDSDLTAWASAFSTHTPTILTLYHTIQTLRKKHFENIVEKGENAVFSIFSFSQNTVYPT